MAHPLRRHLALLLFLLAFFLFDGRAIKAQSLEYKAYKAIHIDRNRKLDGFFNVVSFSTYPLSMVSPGLVYLATTPREDRLWNGLATAGSMGLAMTASTVMKYSIDRKRPYLQYGGATPMNLEGTPSMPSGHTTAAFNMAVNNAIYLKKWYYVVPSYAFAVGVGYSRIHLGAHFLTDVLAGAATGTASGLLTAYLLRQINRDKVAYPLGRLR